MANQEKAEPPIIPADKPKGHQEDPKQASAQAIGSGSEHAQPQPVNHCHSSGQDKKHWLEYATFTVATLGFIAALFAAGFTFWQAWIAKDTEKRQLRAYIVMEGADLQRFGIGNKAHIEVLFENMGLTPAHDAGWMSLLEVLDYTVGPTFSYLGCSVVRNAPENPKWMMGKSKQLIKDWPTAFTADEIARVQAGKGAVYFHGRLCYLDIFEEERHSDFCVYWKWENGGLTFRRCPKGYSAS